MRNSHVSLGAGIAGAVLLAMPVLHMVLGAGAPDAVDAIVGLFGFILLAVSAVAGATSIAGRKRSARDAWPAGGDVWLPGGSRSRSYRRS